MSSSTRAERLNCSCDHERVELLFIVFFLMYDAVDILKKTMVDKLPNDLEKMEATMERVYALVDDVYQYVDGVVVSEGRLIPDNNIGRFISDTLSSLPKLSSAAFEKVFSDRIQDNYALVYLSSLSRAQLGIAEKLNTVAQAEIFTPMEDDPLIPQNLQDQYRCLAVLFTPMENAI
ncbi:Eukaryotic translation initiation factor 3 subunit F [Platanthera guangdongensis]|uniref:Eukaryotic translation initiation factor 3 subunit F n=1 Tax=Platanthera guangdongensis TaxID=2320717 RepID=A0ABR2M1I7_9ASPA